MRVRLISFFIALLLPTIAGADERLWELLRAGGQVVLWRHAQTVPGSGDPTGFRIDDCATQRNLSPEGREQARRIGEVLRARGVRVGAVLTSRWCRAVDTAQLAFGRHEIWEELNSTFHDRSRQAAQSAAVRKRMAAHRGPDNLFLVGHGSNIIDAIGTYPGQGGMVIVTPGGANGFRVAGTLEAAQLFAAPGLTR